MCTVRGACVRACVRGQAVPMALVPIVCSQKNGVTKDWVYVQNREAVLLSG
jgi:hypothetical protein